MEALSAKARFGAAKRVVIKVGSALLVDAASGQVRRDWLQGLAADVVMLRAAGCQVVLVSSGAIALGRRALKLGDGALALEQAQAAAAVGQIRLAEAYQDVLDPHGITAAQVLVTLEDSENRRRYLNTSATMASLLALGAVPIVNENDTVATDEIRYGDNDRLAAQVAALVGADILVLLSDVDGLYTADPRVDTSAKHIASVATLTPEIEAMAGGAGSALAKGGMKTKLIAARHAMRAGCSMAITLGSAARPIEALMKGAQATWFEAASDPSVARKQWISAMKPRGQVHIDAGAEAALRQGKSLLPAGVTQVTGKFGRGDPVEIITASGAVFARALTGYDADEAARIIGCKSTEIAVRLGYAGRATLIHRDDMAI